MSAFDAIGASRTDVAAPTALLERLRAALHDRDAEVTADSATEGEVVAALATLVPDALAMHGALGIPPDVTAATLVDVGEKHRVYGARHELPWLLGILRGDVLSVGRLQVERRPGRRGLTASTCHGPVRSGLTPWTHRSPGRTSCSVRRVSRARAGCSNPYSRRHFPIRTSPPSLVGSHSTPPPRRRPRPVRGRRRSSSSPPPSMSFAIPRGCLRRPDSSAWWRNGCARTRDGRSRPVSSTAAAPRRDPRWRDDEDGAGARARLMGGRGGCAGVSPLCGGDCAGARHGSSSDRCANRRMPAPRPRGGHDAGIGVSGSRRGATRATHHPQGSPGDQQ